MSEYRFDRTGFEAFKAEEKSNDLAYWSKKNSNERLQAAFYLICSAYNIEPTDFPKMDKSSFEMYKRQ